MLLAIDFNDQLDSLVQIVEDDKITMRAGCKNEILILEIRDSVSSQDFSQWVIEFEREKSIPFGSAYIIDYRGYDVLAFIL